MTRASLSAANQEAAAANTARLVVLLDIAFPSGTLRATSGSSPVVYGGNRYNPSGILSDVSGMAETTDLKARRISIGLSGVDRPTINKLMQDAYHFAETNVYLGLLDESGKLVGDPHPVGDSLLMSGAAITLDAGTGTVEVSAETLDIFNQRSSAQLATPESQRLRYAGDTGMDDIRAIAETEVIWGGETWSGSGGGGVGGIPSNKTPNIV